MPWSETYRAMPMYRSLRSLPSDLDKLFASAFASGSGNTRTMTLQSMRHLRGLWHDDEEHSGIQVVVKNLNSSDRDGTILREMFRLGFKNDHDNIVKMAAISDASGNDAYLISRRGQTLEDQVRSRQHVDEVKFKTGMEEGLTYLHKLGVSHRDIKPPNILFEHDHYKYMDFGHSYIHKTNAEYVPLMGTQEYEAPMCDVKLFNGTYLVSSHELQMMDRWTLYCVTDEVMRYVRTKQYHKLNPVNQMIENVATRLDTLRRRELALQLSTTVPWYSLWMQQHGGPPDANTFWFGHQTPCGEVEAIQLALSQPPTATTFESDAMQRVLGRYTSSSIDAGASVARRSSKKPRTS